MIRVDAPGAGEWIMERAQGFFTPGWDHSFSSHREDGSIRGGFALCTYLGNSMTMHMAGDDPGWCSRDLLWMAFDYPFNQLGVGKLIAPVRSDNYMALALDLRAGWCMETVVRDVYAPGVHLMVLTMIRDTCPWLAIRPHGWHSGREVA